MKLKKFPLPPSVNEYLKPSSNNGRFVKTQVYKLFEKNCYIWALKNNADLHDLREIYRDNKSPLHVDVFLVFHRPRIIKKDGVIKSGRNDSNNFIKPIFDALSKLIGVDDAFFNAQYIERVYCENESDQQVILEIRDSKLRSFEDIR